MPFPQLPIIWKKQCPKEVFIDTDKARRFLAENMAMLEESNPVLFGFLMKVLEFKDSHVCKEAHFDAANCAAAICHICHSQGLLPIISQEVYDRVIDEFETRGDVIIDEIIQGDMDINSAVLIKVNSGNYLAYGHHNEADFVRDTALKVYRMIDLQGIIA